VKILSDAPAGDVLYGHASQRCFGRCFFSIVQ
jgi:hypothetical protein